MINAETANFSPDYNPTNLRPDDKSQPRRLTVYLPDLDAFGLVINVAFGFPRRINCWRTNLVALVLVLNTMAIGLILTPIR